MRPVPPRPRPRLRFLRARRARVRLREVSDLVFLRGVRLFVQVTKDGQGCRLGPAVDRRVRAVLVVCSNVRAVLHDPAAHLRVQVKDLPCVWRQVQDFRAAPPKASKPIYERKPAARRARRWKSVLKRTTQAAPGARAAGVSTQDAVHRRSSRSLLQLRDHRVKSRSPRGLPSAIWRRSLTCAPRTS